MIPATNYFDEDKFEILCELANQYDEGKNRIFFENDPQKTSSVYLAMKEIVDIVENPSNKKEPEFEDYYWFGLMNEEGFGTTKNINLAIEYFKKALSTSTCWNGDPEYFEMLKYKVIAKLKKIV